MPGERAPGIHRTGSWVEPTAGLDDVEKRKLFLPYRDSNSDPSLVIHQLVAIPTTLSRLIKFQPFRKSFEK
jgi:hypothetical protein